MSDLISRSAFIDMLLAENQKCITSTGHELTISMVVSFINNAPTAYDVEKVVAELEYLQCVNPFLTTTEYEHKAIEIARKGGVE